MKIKRIAVPIIAVVLLIALLLADKNNWLSSWFGVNLADVVWAGEILTGCIGLLTLYLTITIAFSQQRIESDKIASEKFFKVSFIEEYQRINDSKDEELNLKLKIKESDDNILSSMRIKKEVEVEELPINDKNNKATLIIDSREYEMQHTDKNMDKESKNNKESFCYVWFRILDGFDSNFFKEGETYRFNLDIVGKNVFGVEVGCRLKPWFKVEKKEQNSITFRATHNFGYYDQVKYVGSKNKK